MRDRTPKRVAKKEYQVHMSFPFRWPFKGQNIKRTACAGRKTNSLLLVMAIWNM
jgi:hypothetical protein